MDVVFLVFIILISVSWWFLRDLEGERAKSIMSKLGILLYF